MPQHRALGGGGVDGGRGADHGVFFAEGGGVCGIFTPLLPWLLGIPRVGEGGGLHNRGGGAMGGGLEAILCPTVSQSALDWVFVSDLLLALVRVPQNC